MSSAAHGQAQRSPIDSTKAPLKQLIVLVTGDPIDEAGRKRGGFFHLIRDAAPGAWPGQWRELDARRMTEFPSPSEVSGVIISGSAERIGDQKDWMKRCVGYIRLLNEHRVPTLGICFGHQLMGQAFGALVAPNPAGREIGTVRLEVPQVSKIFRYQDLPVATVNTTHLDSVLTLPAGALVLGRTQLDPLSAVRFSERSWGVQFHPEIDGEVMRYYIDGRREAILQEGLDADALYRDAADAPVGASVVAHFVASELLGVPPDPPVRG